MEASALIWALFLAPGGSSGAETGHVSFTGAELQDPWALCWLLSSCSHQSDSWSSGQWTPINEALPSCVWKPEHARLDRQVRDAGRFFLSQSWVCGTGVFVSDRCSELELHGSILREVCVLIQRHGEPRDVLFSCRLGKIMVRLQLFTCFCKSSFHLENNHGWKQSRITKRYILLLK